MDTNQYIDLFLDESKEHLQAINDQLLKLEKQPQDIRLVEEIFRSAHTLKGMSATMGFEDIASLTHQMENVLDLIRNNQLAVTSEVIDITFESTESLEDMVQDISTGGTGKKDVTVLVGKLMQLEGAEPPEQPVNNNTVQVSDFQLDQYQTTVIAQAKEQGFQAYQLQVALVEDCMLKAARVYMVFQELEELGEVVIADPPVEELEEEKFELTFSVLLLSKQAEEVIQGKVLKVSEIKSVDVFPLSDAEQKQEIDEDMADDPVEPDVSEPIKTKGSNLASKTIRVNIERIDHLMNLFEEMVIDRGRLEDISKKVENQELIETVEHMSRVSQDMQSLMLSMRMVAVDQVFNRFPRMVRGIAKDLHKKIDLNITGADTELDRTVIDEIGDPLVHLIRNSLDHGIESPEKRKSVGKDEIGTIQLRAFHSGNQVIIEIDDDGAGINREKVIAKAIENRLITADKADKLTNNEVYDLIFASGFSTADKVSDISGRGVGLDVVRSKIQSLGGHVFVESEPGNGSKFTIQLPLTLSILATLLVKVADETYAIPLSSIEETVFLHKSQLMKVQHQSVMDFRGKVVPLVFLADVFDVPDDKEFGEKDGFSVVVVRKGDKLTGIVVDSFIGQKEVVLKSLGNLLQDIFAISGATILGDGRVALIIDTNALSS